MSDISSFWDVESLAADWREGRGDLVSGDDLQTAIIISLFTDRVARDDDDIDGDDRRGWWGDADEENDIGSRLWLLRRQKLTQSVAQKAEDYSREALQWLVTDGVVSSFSVATQIVYPRRLNMVIRYQSPGNGNDTDMRFFWVWEQ
ncbi:phage GP46 family protein [Yersinia intermedia]|uniref:phage GP46 family protein n=1 Tax=Yersinia intermedia TaxID=631 RepID=UPI0011A8A074|nr:phage GP46 family protein [Yersinia intermedia]ELW7390573.1 phage GP46 family protein [Yersinia enterocolitica]